MTVRGIVLTQKPLREQDKFIDILTETGVMEILVKGSAKMSSKSGSATQLFAYSEFDISDRHAQNKARILTGVTPIQIFYGLRNSVSLVALASYFAQIVLYSSLPKSSTPELIRLFLNCLHYLSEQNVNAEHDESMIKCIFELRTASLLGFQPDVIMCRKCGEYLPERLYFSIEQGCFWCDTCADKGVLMLSGALQAIRHITLQDFEKIFLFRVADHCRPALYAFAEQFLQYHIDRKFPALDYYKQIKQ